MAHYVPSRLVGRGNPMGNNVNFTRHFVNSETHIRRAIMLRNRITRLQGKLCSP